MPCVECSVAGDTMIDGGETMAAELNVVVDPAVGEQKPLSVASRIEPLHLPFSSPRRLMRHLSTVIETGGLDFAIIDATMPEISGYEPARCATNRNIAALLLGDHPDADTKLRGSSVCHMTNVKRSTGALGPAVGAWLCLLPGRRSRGEDRLDATPSRPRAGRNPRRVPRNV